MAPSIVHLASELNGGAGIAALRLHLALQAQGGKSTLVYARGQTQAGGNAYCFHPLSGPVTDLVDKLSDRWHRHRAKPGASLFSRPTRSACGIPPQLAAADVVHLHWTAKWLDLPALFRAIRQDCPIVLTLHDSCFFTGGCHQTNGCFRYRQACGSCPQLRMAWPGDPSRSGFLLRQRLYAGRKLFVVPNSRWTASLASGASLFKHARVLAPVYPGLDLSIFMPQDRRTCRNLLGLPQDRLVLCAGGADWGDINKGFPLLLNALQRLPDSVQERMILLAYGSGSLPAKVGQVSVRHLGYLSSDRLLAMAYSASDAYCTPSLMETFGMTAVEAMACALPVIAFKTGGLQEIVRPGETGWLVPEVGSEAALAGALSDALTHPNHLPALGTKARRDAEDRFPLEHTASAYETVYRCALEPRDTA